MKLAIILTILCIFVAGCSTQDAKVPLQNNSQTDNNTTVLDLTLNAQDLKQLGIISNGTDCQTEEYQTSEFSPLALYSTCYYAIHYNKTGVNDTQIVLEIKKFSNLNDLDGAYQYDSSHYYSVQGLISENDFGDKSRFRVNNENDYGGEFNTPGVYFYHLWICKDTYLIHITSKGVEEDKAYIADIGRQILSKFN